MDNDALNSMDQFYRTVLAMLDRLHRLAPAAIEDGIGSRYARGGSSVIRTHDSYEHVDRSPGVAARYGANLDYRFSTQRHPTLRWRGGRRARAKSSTRSWVSPRIKTCGMIAARNHFPARTGIPRPEGPRAALANLPRRGPAPSRMPAKPVFKSVRTTAR